MKQNSAEDTNMLKEFTLSFLEDSLTHSENMVFKYNVLGIITLVVSIGCMNMTDSVSLTVGAFILGIVIWNMKSAYTNKRLVVNELNRRVEEDH